MSIDTAPEEKAVPMDNLTKAIALARIGAKVFPVDRRTRAPKTVNGFYDGVSDDFEMIATWFTLDYADSDTVVGVWMGGSGLLALDVDKGKKNGKDGFKSIKEASRPIGTTESYRTASGGEHRIWQTDRIDLAPGTDSLGMEGVDIRAGGSYVIWWGDHVPESRKAFSADIPDWIIEASTPSEETFSGEGHSGSVADWLEAIPDDILPSGKVVDFLARIPKGEFGHPEMVDLAWGIVRMGSERETGVSKAVEALRAAWLRAPYDTPQYRRDFDLALRGAINKAGRVQKPVPVKEPWAVAKKSAEAAGAWSEVYALERKVSETSTEIELSRIRKEMFNAAADAGMSAGCALGIVAGSKAFTNSKVTFESAWFGDGEAAFHDRVEAAVPQEDEEQTVEEAEDLKLFSLAADAELFTFLNPGEQAIADSYDWWGRDYLAWVETRLKHYNKPYHVGAMWAALSLIASPWGKVPVQGASPMDCNLYMNQLGMSSSGKSEAWSFGREMIDAYYGTEKSPIVGDAKKATALSLHRTLILKDGAPSLVYSDEVQSFFRDLKTSHWQGTILGDLSEYYGGNVPPKNTMNDKEISGKRAKSLLTTYFTGIASQTFDALSLDNWGDGLLFRFLWGFGHARAVGDYEMVFESTSASYTAPMEGWAREFRRVGALQEVKWGAGRVVLWEENARKRMGVFLKQIDETVKASPLYDDIMVSANGRFKDSILKCATLIAMAEASEKVTLDHLLVAMSFAGPWHRSMVMAVSETAKDPFDREVEKCLVWIKRNATKQIGKPAWIQRSAVMRAFKPNEIAERLLRQLTEEGWLIKVGDIYQISES